MAYDASRAPINMFAGVPSDTAQIGPASGFIVGVTGNVAVMPYHQESQSTPEPVVFYNVPVGVPIRDIIFSRLMNTNTTASHITLYGSN